MGAALRCRLGAAPTGLPRVVGRCRDPGVWVLFVGGASVASIGPLWLSALQGQAALGLRLPDLSRREARVSRARARGESSLAGPKKPVQPERD